MVPDFRIQQIQAALGHRYEFRSFLGKGAFASVLLVENRKLERLEAMKILAQKHYGDPGFVRRFEREAKLVAAFDHPNIVQVYDFGEVDGVIWYTMQHIDGPSLRAELQHRDRLPSREVVHLAIPLLDALQFSHQQGVVHRDVKPANIIINRRGFPFLMDFGLAKGQDDIVLTQEGRILGTPAYIAPEQAAGKKLDGRSDLYSFGTTLYRALCGRTPFEGLPKVQALAVRLTDDAPSPSSLGIEIPPDLERILMRSLARSREDRYPSAGAMRKDLLSYVAPSLGTGEFRLEQSTLPSTSELWSFQSRELHFPERSLLRDLGSHESTEENIDSSQSESDPYKTQPWAPPISAEPSLGGIEGALEPVSETVPENISKSRIPSLDQGWPQFFLWAIVLVALFLVGLRHTSSPEEVPLGVEMPATEPLAEISLPGSAGPRQATSSPSGPAAETSSLPEEEVRSRSQTPSSPGGEDRMALEESGGAHSEGEPRIQESEHPATVTVDSLSPAEGPGREPLPDTLPVEPATFDEPPIRRPVVAPRLVDSPEPSRAAKRICRGQEIILQAQIGPDGRVTSCRALTQGTPGCLAEAKSVIELHRFEPALDFQGDPVAASITLSLRFPGDSR